LSEITPDYSLNSNPNRAPDSLHTLNSQSTTATGVDLALVTIKPSQLLWRIELAFYSCVLCAATIALFPFLLTAFYWPIIWLIFVLLVMFVLRERWRAQKIPAVTLSVQKQVWRFQNSNGEFTVVPFGEILLWGGVIILPMREIASGHKHHIVALPDSMKPEDWRRLRVWLRTGLRNNI
jgi:hypothetical protein